MFYKFRGNYRKQIDSANITNPIFSSKIYFLSRSFLSFRFFSVDARAGITLDEKMQGSKEERERRRTREMQSWSRRSRLSKKEGRVHGVREKGIERSGARSVDEWVGNARNGIPRSQLRSHPDLTRPYSGLIVIAFCLFARRSLPLFTAALITFFSFAPAKNRTTPNCPLILPPLSLCSIDRPQ